MSERGFHESVHRADRWSRVVALFVAIGLFLVANYVTADSLFSAVVAAIVGIGVRLYIPHHAAVRVPEEDRIALSDHPMAGNYHHGAAGVGLVLAGVVTFGVFVVGHGFVTAVGSGLVVGAVVYLVFSSLLPSH